MSDFKEINGYAIAIKMSKERIETIFFTDLEEAKRQYKYLEGKLPQKCFLHHATLSGYPFCAVTHLHDIYKRPDGEPW